MTELPHEELLTGYLDGELTAEERAIVERLLHSSAEARQLLEELRALREAIRALPRYAISTRAAADTFAQRVLQQAEREMFTSGSALSETARPQTVPPESEPSPGESSAPSSETNETHSRAAGELPTAGAVAEETRDLSCAPSLADGNGWKRLLAAAAVLAAAITLMVLGPKEPAPTPTPVALQSSPPSAAGLGLDAAVSDDAISPGDELPAAAPWQTEPAGAAMQAAPRQAPPPQAAMPPAPSMPGATPAAESRAFSLGELSHQPAAASLQETPAEAQPQAQRAQPAIDVDGLTAGLPFVGSRNAPLSEKHGIASEALIRGPALVVHVQLTHEAWQQGRFTQTLQKWQIAWHDRPSESGKAAGGAPGSVQAETNKPMPGADQDAGSTTLRLVQVRASVDQLQGLIADLQSAAVQSGDVLALAVATPAGYAYREAEITAANGTGMHRNSGLGRSAQPTRDPVPADRSHRRLSSGDSAGKQNDAIHARITSGTLHENAAEGAAESQGEGMDRKLDHTRPVTDEVAPPYSPLDPEPRLTSRAQRGAAAARAGAGAAKGGAAPDGAVEGKTSGPPFARRQEIERQHFRAAEPDQVRAGQEPPPAVAFPLEATPPPAADQSKAAPSSAHRASQDRAGQDKKQHDRPLAEAQSANPAATTEALFVIQLVPSPEK